MKTAILAALALVCLSLPTEARPRHHSVIVNKMVCVETGTVLHPVCGMGAPANRAKNIQILYSDKGSNGYTDSEARRRARGQALYDAMPFGMPTDRAGKAVNWVKPRAWCGWQMRVWENVSNPAGNVARWWAGYGRKAHGPAVGTIVVWRHHVGKITGRDERSGQWIVKSGNDGHAVRERPRSVANAIAFRWPA